ncbi:MAG: recombinase family protein [Candidatus Hodarchaeales archaeon]|jgi:DNA invertase Pin-like site-specific DNA recombinase
MLNINVALYCQASDYGKIEGINKELREKIDMNKKSSVNFTSIYYYDIINKRNEDENGINSTPMLSKLLADIKTNKKYDLVAIPTMDILGENLHDIRKKINEFHKYGVELFPVNDQYFRIKNDIETKLYTSPMNRIKVPYGYIIRKGIVLPHLDKNIRKNEPLRNRNPGNIVQWIFQSFLKLGSYSEVANKLNEKKVPSPLQVIKERKGRSSKKSTWNRQQVKNILINNFYSGEESAHTSHTGIITTEVWKKVQKIAKKIQRN